MECSSSQQSFFCHLFVLKWKYQKYLENCRNIQRIENNIINIERIEDNININIKRMEDNDRNIWRVEDNDSGGILGRHEKRRKSK